jgi:hypothetical protein
LKNAGFSSRQLSSYSGDYIRRHSQLSRHDEESQVLPETSPSPDSSSLPHVLRLNHYHHTYRECRGKHHPEHTRDHVSSKHPADRPRDCLLRQLLERHALPGVPNSTFFVADRAIGSLGNGCECTCGSIRREACRP